MGPVDGRAMMESSGYNLHFRMLIEDYVVGSHSGKLHENAQAGANAVSVSITLSLCCRIRISVTFYGTTTHLRPQYWAAAVSKMFVSLPLAWRVLCAVISLSNDIALGT